MAEQLPDEALAHALRQMGIATFDQVELVRAIQAEQAKKGTIVRLADILLQQGVVTPVILENVAKKIQARQAGGIKQLGSYKLVKKIGEGGMGQVFLAEDTHVGRMAAVKVLPKKFSDDHQFLTRFRREAIATGRLNHVNIVCAYNVGEDQGIHYYAMEYCDGESLSSLIKKVPFIPWDAATGIIMQAARGLKHAHEHGIIHRDIKPENIYICRALGESAIATGRPLDVLGEGFIAKILDLGLSKDLGNESSATFTQTGVAMGTPYYISPEQAKGEKQIDGRTDIYSLGATYYHLVTGETPFKGSTGAVIMLKHLTEQLPNPQDVNDAIPGGVVHIIQKMMAKDPDDRYANCKELLEDLELVIDGKMPSSQVIDVGKSSVGMSRRQEPRGVQAVGRGTGKNEPIDGSARRGTRRHDPVAAEGRRGTRQVKPVDRRSGRKGEQADPNDKASVNKTMIYVGAGVGVLVLVGVLALMMGSGFLLSGKSGDKDATRLAAAEEKRADEAEGRRKDEDARRTAEAARMERERRKLEDDQRRAETAKVEADKAKLEAEKQKVEAEKRRWAEEARWAAEAEAKKKAEAATIPQSPIPNPKLPTPSVPAMSSVAKEENARRLFSAVLKETAPLLAENQFTDALALLDRKAKAPALVDAAELLKQEQADLAAVVELRCGAIEALRKKVGEQVSLRKGNRVIKGKVVADPKPDVVTLDVGGPQISLRADQVHVDDIEQHAPKTGNAGEDLRRRGLLYLYAGQIAKAKEFFTKPQTLNPEAYLDRIAALELGEVEAGALQAWENAEKLFAARNLKGAQEAYDAFTKAHGQTNTAKGQVEALKERYAAIDKVLGPAPTITVDLAPGVKMEMVLVKAGEFDMGANDGEGSEKPVHKVKISKPYYIAKYETTVAQFRAFADATKYQTEAEKAGHGWSMQGRDWKEQNGINWRTPGFKQEDSHPACVISWNDAQEFCKWATKLARRTVHLPSEAQWEYAARGPKSPKYPWGDKCEGVVANVADASLKAAGFSMQWGEVKEDDGFPYTSPVGQYKNSASWCGAFDMAGNIWEWVEDRFDGNYYANSPAVDPPGPATGNERVLRGGCWVNGPANCRAARRLRSNPGARAADNGFRCALDF